MPPAGSGSWGCPLGEGRWRPGQAGAQPLAPARASLWFSLWIDSPLPTSGRWQRSRESRGEGRPGNPLSAVGPEAFTPARWSVCSGPGCTLPARLAFLFLFLCFSHVYLLSVCPHGLTSIYFLLARGVSPCPSSFFLLSVTLSVPQPLCLSQPPAPLGTPFLPPERWPDQASSSPGARGGAGRQPPCHFQGPGL